MLEKIDAPSPACHFQTLKKIVSTTVYYQSLKASYLQQIEQPGPQTSSWLYRQCLPSLLGFIYWPIHFQCNV